MDYSSGSAPEAHAHYPRSCRRYVARVLFFGSWRAALLPRESVERRVLPFLVDRLGGVQWLPRVAHREGRG